MLVLDIVTCFADHLLYLFGSYNYGNSSYKTYNYYFVTECNTGAL